MIKLSGVMGCKFDKIGRGEKQNYSFKYCTIISYLMGIRYLTNTSQNSAG
jgi:hypothetical protein